MSWMMHTATDAHGQAGSKLLWTAPPVQFNNLPTFHFVSDVIDFYSPFLNLFPGLLFSCPLHATQDNIFQVGVNSSVLNIHHLEQNMKILFLCLLLCQEHSGRFPEKHEQQIFTRPFVSGRPTWDSFSKMLSVKIYFLVILSENWLNRNKCRKEPGAEENLFTDPILVQQVSPMNAKAVAPSSSHSPPSNNCQVITMGITSVNKSAFIQANPKGKGSIKPVKNQDKIIGFLTMVVELRF